MASISSTGLGSGLDVESIITKLMALEEKPVTQLKTQAATIQTKISAYGAVQSAVSTFRDAALNLTRATTWGVTAATSSDESSVRVTTTDGAVAGAYAITVNNLATPQSAVSRTFESSASLVGEGSLRVEIGSFGQAGFAPQPNLAAMNINISATDSLATVREKINAAGAGVSAVIVNDATGARLIISSTNPGASNVFRITPTGSGSIGDLGFDPGAASPMTQTSAGVDARLNVNGVDITASSNVLTNTISGMTINLLRPSAVDTATGVATPVQVGVTQDNTAIKASMKTFVDAYNSLATMLKTNTKYDESTKTAGKLQGDSTAVALQNNLRRALGDVTGASTVFTNMRDIGLETQADGTLKLNDSKLTSALANLPELRKFFAAVDTTPDDNVDTAGIAQRLRLLGDNVLSFDGALTTRSTGLADSLQRNQKQQDVFTQRMALTEARLRKQYTALDTSMSSLTALNTYITNQVAQWNKGS